MSGRRTLIAISAAVALGIVGAASTARASDSGENHQDNDRSAVSGSVARANAGVAYGYAAAPIHKQRPVYEQTQSR